MKLFAISDIHVGNLVNRRAWQGVSPHPGDWLVLAGDVCETEEDLAFALDVACQRFAQVLWVPGNHELWTIDAQGRRGEQKYLALVRLCRERGVLTPEDPYARWPADPQVVLAPLFLLYDYSFAPEGLTPAAARAWAMEQHLRCADEDLLSPDPYPSREAWCRARVELTRRRLDELGPDTSTVLINHFPLREDDAVLPAIPRFKIWCGTKQTEDWHVRYRARAVVYGHLHLRKQRQRDGIPFHEVSLGMPRQWNAGSPVDEYLREILDDGGR